MKVYAPWARVCLAEFAQRGDNSRPPSQVRGFPPPCTETVVTKTLSRRRSPSGRWNAGGVSLFKCSQNKLAMPTHADRTQRIPTSNPCVILHHQGLFGVSYAVGIKVRFWQGLWDRQNRDIRRKLPPETTFLWLIISLLSPPLGWGVLISVLNIYTDYIFTYRGDTKRMSR